MVIVAVACVVLALIVWMQRRAATFRDRAILFQLEGAFPNDPSDPVLDRRTIHNRAMADKYWRAFRYPWLPVAPDPPEPKTDEDTPPDNSSTDGHLVIFFWSATIALREQVAGMRTQQ
jgi:hypothetical protein